MKKIALIISLVIISNCIFAENLSFFKNYYPKKSYIYFLNKKLKGVNVVSKGRFGTFETNYTTNSEDNKLTIDGNNGDKIEVVFSDNNTSSRIFDTRGLWQTFDINFDNDGINSYLWTHRFLVEGKEEPLMIEEDNIFSYEGSRLIEHKRPSQYRNRLFNYENDQLKSVKNFLGNGEDITEVVDIYSYSTKTDYTVKPCSELSFYSMHYPIMDKKMHTVTIENNIETRKDTYYHDGNIYFEYIEVWEGDKVLSLSTFTSVGNNNTKFIYKY